jgi:hypothetical protein
VTRYAGFLSLALVLSAGLLRAQDCAKGQQCAVPDVAGVWQTRHIFDISAALPPALVNGFTPLRRVDTDLLARLDHKRRDEPLKAIVASEIAKHRSPHLPALLRIGDDLRLVVGRLRSRGVLVLTPGADPAHVQAAEVWTSLVFYWLGLCGDNVGGDPELPPECARFDIATSDNDNPTEVPQCEGQTVPEVGTLVQHDAQTWQLAIGCRRARLKVGDVVLAVIDDLAEKTTPWHSIEEATDCRAGACVIDCAGLAAALGDLLPRGDDSIEAMCAAVVRKAGRETMRELARAFADAAVLRFSGFATVSGSGKAVALGFPDYELRLIKDPQHRDGSWTGSFFSKALTNAPGAWYATRSPQ